MSEDQPQIKVQKGLDVIRRRPGMFLGGTGKRGAARLLSLAGDVLLALSVSREPSVSFTRHAFFEVVLDGRNGAFVIDFHPEEVPDFSERSASLIAHREDLNYDKYALFQGVNGVAPLPVLLALTDGFHLVRVGSEWEETIISKGTIGDFLPPLSEKGCLVAASFRVCDAIDLSDLSKDYLEGYFHSWIRVPGLVLRSVRFTPLG